MFNVYFVIYVLENLIDRSIGFGSLIIVFVYEKFDWYFVDWVEDIG